MSVVLSASIFPKEEADIREKKHISSDGKFNALYLYSLHYYSTILLSVLLLGTVVSEREVKQRGSLDIKILLCTTNEQCVKWNGPHQYCNKDGYCLLP